VGAREEAQVRADRGRQPHRAEHSGRRQAQADRLTALLSLGAVEKSFGALKVVDRLSLEVGSRELLGIIGPNGAGKTTLFNLITGELRADAGSIRFLGEEVGALAPHQRCRKGIGRSYQIPQPFAGMTVFENLLVAASFGAGLAEEQARVTCAEILRNTALLSKANRLAGGLTLLERKRLELARALATQPQLLLLDEIAGGLTEPEARELVALIRELKAAGLAMVWIEHVMHALVAVADRILVINFGARLAEGAPEAVMRDPEVQRVYLGIEA
jgi:branched-chain amino acid transport system ATP-binding protein